MRASFSDAPRSIDEYHRAFSASLSFGQITHIGRNSMFSRIRKRLTYANVAMTMALVFAMSGGAYAAKKYVITSTKQIKPSVL